MKLINLTLFEFTWKTESGVYTPPGLRGTSYVAAPNMDAAIIYFRNSGSPAFIEVREYGSVVVNTEEVSGRDVA